MSGIIKATIITILITTVLISCRKEHDIYSIFIKNNYFENIENVKIGNNEVGSIKSMMQSESIPIAKGSYTFSAQTFSGLSIRTHLFIAGNKKTIYLTLNKNGKLSKE